MNSLQTKQDLEHLNLLGIFHYVLGGLLGVTGCFPIIHLTVGFLMVTAAESQKKAGDPPFAAFGFIFMGVAAFMILFFWALAVCTVLAGRYLHRQQHYMFCLIVACVLCTFTPLGTVLGVFTIIVLIRPSVKALFQAQDAVPVQE
jgi:hypothetical protein